MRLPVFLAAAILLAAAVPASAQAHEHGVGGAVVIAHDVPADGTTFVGTINHFAVIVKGDDPVPDFHNNIHVRVVLNGLVLFETTPDSGHDYDGVNAFDVVFPAAGSYSVEALDPDDDAKMVAMFGGHVLPAPGADAPQAEFVVSAVSAVPTEQVMAGQPVHFTVDLLDAPASSGGARIDHSDTWFEAWMDGRLEFRTKLHTHDELQELDYAFQQAGSYVVRLTGYLAYPSKNATLFAPVVHEQSIMVLPGAPVSAVHPESPPMPAAGLNAVVQGKTGGQYLLVGTFDPFTVVGPDTLQHLYALVVDPTTGEPIQHVNFKAVFHGPVTHVFSSDTLHEYDGIYELTSRQVLPGAYTLDVTAERGDWTDTIHMTYLVAPPVVAVPTVSIDVGPVMFDLQQPAALLAGATGDFLLHGADVAGEPFAHNEVEFRLFAAGADESRSVPLLSGKLHTHDDGDYGFRLAFPEAGTYKLELTPTPLMANPVLLTAQSFDITVASGPGVPPSTADAAASAKESPGAPGALVLVGLAALAMALRRRA
ncbi:MAG: hypothetical protein QOJ26_1185 [Thermoplasmata archaeon]|jgi:hypothetical protein|nr:hypothetical protein [Thermoplasmata archaeon]MEA3166313.1 hypothetical protein [Thermoplasmata archaeon]